MELLIAEPADWLPIYDDRQDVLEQGWELLAPLLANDQQVADLLGERPEPAAAAEPSPGRRARDAGRRAGCRTSRTSPSRRSPTAAAACASRCSSWRRGSPTSRTATRPASVSPVLATYARWFASALDDRRRQTLKDRARRLIGTASPGGPARRAAVRRTCRPTTPLAAWLATDWLIRVQAASWLKLAGLTEAAARLESIGPTSNHLDLVRAVDVLGSAIIDRRSPHRPHRLDRRRRAGRRRPARRPGRVGRVGASGRSRAAWVAASEAASVGVPAELAYATDLRVIECARDAHVRDDLEANRRSIGDTAWATALHAIADEAWTAGWDAAHPAVDALAVLPLKTATDRAVRAALSRAGADDDARETSLDAAESAAKERLTRAALGSESWASEVHPWDAAFEAAADTPGGRAVGVGAGDDAGRGRRGPVGGRHGRRRGGRSTRCCATRPTWWPARSAPPSLARPPAAAARGVALRAAAVARAQGATAAEATAGGRGRARPRPSLELQDAAFALLDVLISVNEDEAAATG